MKAYRKCLVDGCDNDGAKPGSGVGYCAKHYVRFRKYGDATAYAPPRPKAKLAQWIEDVALKYCGDDCLIWPFYRNQQGYGVYCIGGRPNIASRVICEKTYGPPPEPFFHAAHSCNNGHLGCVNPRHLSWKTPHQNEADKISNGTRIRGELHVWAKLTEEEVREIRASKGLVRVDDAAARFGISRWTVFDIRSGRRWGHMA